MSFPETRKTLIRRIAVGGDDAAWQEFMSDYWGPVCRFACRRASLKMHDAEDIASQVFEAFLRNELLARWVDCPVAKLRTLICTVVRNVLSNRARVQSGRERLLEEHFAAQRNALAADAPEQDDIFYAAWVDELLQSTVEGLLSEYHHAGRGDYFRVLYGRLCESLSFSEISELLRIKPTTTANYFRHAKQRLGERLREIVQGHVTRYSTSPHETLDFDAEWQVLGEYLQQRGGLEEAVRCAYHNFKPRDRQQWQAMQAKCVARLTAFRLGDASSDGEPE